MPCFLFPFEVVWLLDCDMSWIATLDDMGTERHMIQSTALSTDASVHCNAALSTDAAAHCNASMPTDAAAHSNVVILSVISAGDGAPTSSSPDMYTAATGGIVIAFPGSHSTSPIHRTPRMPRTFNIHKTSDGRRIRTVVAGCHNPYRLSEQS